MREYPRRFEKQLVTMKISFDFDGTLTVPKVFALAEALSKKNELYSITSSSRSEPLFNKFKKYTEPLCMPEECIIFCGGTKTKQICKHRIDVHYDDDQFQTHDVLGTDTLGILVDTSMFEIKKTEPGIVHI